MTVIVVVSISSPLLIGIYKDKKLIEKYKSEDKTSEALPSLFFRAYNKYMPKIAVYTNGPGKLTSIKLTYIFLKSVAILKDLKLLSIDAFYFCNNMPIKAMASSYFVKNSGKIEIKKLNKPPKDSNFDLPKEIDISKFSTDIEPLYLLPSVD